MVACVDPDPASLSRFEQALAPFGYWVDDREWGRVWIPADHLVGAEFHPFLTDGKWAKTTKGEWVWMNQLRFMDATFHFGRWTELQSGRWAWIAGSCYADAWVAWRTTDIGSGYIGWAPQSPSWLWREGRAIAAPSAQSVWSDCPVERVFDFPAQACAMSAQEAAMLSRLSVPYRRAIHSSHAGLVPVDATPRGPVVNLDKSTVVEVRPQQPPLAPQILKPGTDDDAGDLALAGRMSQLPLEGLPGWRPFPRATVRLSTGGEVALYGRPCYNDVSVPSADRSGNSVGPYGYRIFSSCATGVGRQGFPPSRRPVTQTRAVHGNGAVCGAQPESYTIVP